MLNMPALAPYRLTSWPMPTETRTLKIAGHALTVSAHGRGQPHTPLLLIHGAGGTYVQWPPRLRRLPDRPVFALELPGHGRTPGPGLDSIPAFAALVSAWMDQEEIGPCVVAGHSLGATIALTLALEAPQRVAALIVVGSGARMRASPILLSLLRDDPPAAATFIAEGAYAAGTPPATLARFRHELLRMDPELLRSAFAACDGFDVRPRLHDLTAPLLVVGAEEDRMAPPRFSAELHEACPGSTLHILPCGHMIPVEQPAKLTQLVLAFIQQHRL